MLLKKEGLAEEDCHTLLTWIPEEDGDQVVSLERGNGIDLRFRSTLNIER